MCVGLFIPLHFCTYVRVEEQHSRIWPNEQEVQIVLVALEQVCDEMVACVHKISFSQPHFPKIFQESVSWLHF